MIRELANLRTSTARRPAAPRERRRGSAILEMSLVLPALLMLMLLCVDFGRAPFYYIAVTNAARAGAGYASANPYPYNTTAQATWMAGAQNAITAEFATNSWYNSADLTTHTVSFPTTAQLNAGGYWNVSVTVTYSFQTLINWTVLSSTYHSSTYTITRTVVMQGSI